MGSKTTRSFINGRTTTKNKQFCKEFLSQLNTTILPADVKCSKENSNAQQEQDNGEKSGMNLDQNDQYTPFERLLLKYKDAFHLEEGLIQNIHRLVEALDKRDKYPGVSSKSRVTCPKCDQHYWNEHKLHSKGHLKMSNNFIFLMLVIWILV